MTEQIYHDKYVLVGVVPLFAVTNMTLDEQFKIPTIGKGDKSQWLGKVGYTVTIQGALLGPERFLWKAALELIADLSMILNSFVSIPGLGGIPLVSDLTVLTDMQITSLKFTQTSQEFGAIGVTISLKHCPKGFVAELIGRGLNVASSLGGSTLVREGVRGVGNVFG